MSATAAGARDVGASHASALCLLNQPVSVEFLRLEDELIRRRGWSLGAVPDRELLGVLFTLPVDHPVPRATLTARQQRILRRAPQGVVELWRREVTRLLVPAVRVVHVTAQGSPSVLRLRQFSQFASFAERSVVLRGQPSPTTVTEATRWGIGVVDGSGRSVVAGRPFILTRHTAATWLFQEVAFGELLRMGAESL